MLIPQFFYSVLLPFFFGRGQERKGLMLYVSGFGISDELRTGVEREAVVVVFLSVGNQPDGGGPRDGLNKSCVGHS